MVSDICSNNIKKYKLCATQYQCQDLCLLRNISHLFYDGTEVNKDYLNESIPHIYSLVYFRHILCFRNLIGSLLHLTTPTKYE
jgi:hypothetical protein